MEKKKNQRFKSKGKRIKEVLVRRSIRNSRFSLEQTGDRDAKKSIPLGIKKPAKPKLLKPSFSRVRVGPPPKKKVAPKFKL